MGIISYLSICDWFTLLSIMSPKLIYTIFCDRISFFFKAALPDFPYPFICQWTLGLLPLLGFYEKCCREHGSASIFPHPAFSSFECTLRSRISGSHDNSLSDSLRKLCCFPWRLHCFTFSATGHEGSNFSTSFPTLVIFCSSGSGHPKGCEVVPCCFDVLSLMINIYL